MRRWIRNEAGQLELGAGILILLGLMAIPFAMAGAKDISDLQSGKWDKKEVVAPPAPVTIPVFSKPALPAATDPRYACYISRAASLRFVNGGWTHPDYPPPTLTGIYAKDRKEVDDWAKIVGEFIAAADFKQCDQEQEVPKPPKEELADPNVEGTYQATFAYQGGPPTACNTGGFAGTITVTQGGGKGRVSLATGGRVFAASLHPDLSFEGRFDANGPVDTIRGGFHGTNESRTIESGFLSFGAPDGDTPCAYTFDAVRGKP